MYKSALTSGLLLFLFTQNVFAVDSYRFMHVTIDTPWIIFIFLLCIIMVPFILSAVLYWYFAFKKNQEEDQAQAENKSND